MYVEDRVAGHNSVLFYYNWVLFRWDDLLEDYYDDIAREECLVRYLHRLYDGIEYHLIVYTDNVE